MYLDPHVRADLAAGVLDHRQGAIPGSNAVLRGSLAGTQADQYSDIDVLRTVPNQTFAEATLDVGAILARVQPLTSIRSDPAFRLSSAHRLIFVRFVDVPLFWRLDLDIATQTQARDEAANSTAPAHDTQWSRTESALMNAVAAVKAHLRGNDTRARQVLIPGFERVCLAAPNLPLRDQIMDLVDGIRTVDPAVNDLARRVGALVVEAFAGG